MMGGATGVVGADHGEQGSYQLEEGGSAFVLLRALRRRMVTKTMLVSGLMTVKYSL